MSDNKPSGEPQPTNGPYHWGNGPQPKGKSCGFVALALMGALLTVPAALAVLLLYWGGIL